jgi:hypothetical protein
MAPHCTLHILLTPLLLTLKTAYYHVILPGWLLTLRWQSLVVLCQHHQSFFSLQRNEIFIVHE